MKVCTDACLFGAWTANFIRSHKLPVINCLDIGTGTGLLSLMLAQKADGNFDAVEIEINAFEQAKENFYLSPWSNRLSAIHGDIKFFNPAKKYDLLISNPPFFENHLRSENVNKNLARHEKGLNLKQLISFVDLHMNETGYLALLLPYHRLNYFETLASANNIFVDEKVLIRQKPGVNYFRTILLCSRLKKVVATKELIISNNDEYSDEFAELLKDYYLLL